MQGLQELFLLGQACFLKNLEQFPAISVCSRRFSRPGSRRGFPLIINAGEDSRVRVLTFSVRKPWSSLSLFPMLARNDDATDKTGLQLSKRKMKFLRDKFTKIKINQM